MNILTFAASLAFMLSPLTAGALSTVINQHESGDFSPGYMETSYNLWLQALRNPNIQVRYTADATDAAGTSVCGASVPVGTEITFRFASRKNADVTWNGTGGAWDTPYGYWVDRAGPPGALCFDVDRVSTFTSTAWGSIAFFTPLSVNPPLQSMADMSGLSCSPPASDGSVTCVADASGTFNPKFTFSPTYARFYFHTKASRNTSQQCGGRLASPWFGLGLIQTDQPMRRFAVDNWNRGSVGYGDAGFVINDGWGGNSQATWSWMKSTANNGAGGSDVWTGSNVPQPRDIPIAAASLSCPITVIEPEPDNQAPGTPDTGSGSSACTIGQSRTITMTASDPGDQVRYHIDWDADGTVDQYVPATGYVAAGTSQSASRTFAVAGAKEVRVRAEDDAGALSPWQTLSIGCADTETAELDTGEMPEGDADLLLGPDAEDLAIRAVPSLVRSGGTTQIHWSSQNMTACTVSGSNGDAWSGLASPVSGQPSGAIESLVTYTLSCTGTDGGTYAKEAEVRVLPSWMEK